MRFNLRGVDLGNDLLVIPRFECEVLRVEGNLLNFLDLFVADYRLHLIVRVVDD